LEEYEQERTQAILIIKKRNPKAFTPSNNIIIKPKQINAIVQNLTAERITVNAALHKEDAARTVHAKIVKTSQKRR